MFQTIVFLYSCANAVAVSHPAGSRGTGLVCGSVSDYCVPL